MEQRKQFLREYESKEWTMAALCRAHGISRQTGYEVVRRYQKEGEAGLEERSRAPHQHPNQVAEEIEEQLLELRRAHMRWGPRKLRHYLAERQPQQKWPAASTIGALLEREGLVLGRRKRRRTEPYTQPLAGAKEPNQVWCADFKGWFRTQDGARIDPLTITDGHSRYLLRCQAVAKTDTERVRAIFAAAFREYGLPQAIRTDNGAPFASRAIAGLSRLAVSWMKLEIVPERIQPGHPEQNGRHERMHRTLKEETATPPAGNARAQQRAFARFQKEYNQERPHEALGQKTPASFYRTSPRAYPERVREPEYDQGLEVRRVQKHGEFGWKNQVVFLSETLAGERVGLELIEDDYWLVYFAAFPIACFDSRELCVRPLPRAEEPAAEESGGNDGTGASSG